MRVALHACCGPCLLEPLDALAAEHDIVVVYANPNIHPLAEYERRRDTLTSWTAENDIRVVELAYDPAEWMRAVSGVESDPSRRCEACFRLRLGKTAAWAAEMGFDAIATTLTVSPYQDAAAIERAGRASASEAGVDYIHRDFRERYPEATRRSRGLSMYRQNYCGCLLSEIEARQARERRRKPQVPGRRSVRSGEPQS